jgi:hypothetical protein
LTKEHAMNEMLDPEDRTSRFISCEVCQHEIPLSEAVVPEATDYVAYFCSPDCFAAWRARAAADRFGVAK